MRSRTPTSAAEPSPSPVDLDGESVQHRFSVQPASMTPFARVRRLAHPIGQRTAGGLDGRRNGAQDLGMFFLQRYMRWTWVIVPGLCIPVAAPLAVAQPEIRWSGNRILNPSFEDEFTGWYQRKGAEQAGERIESSVTLDDTTAHSGARSLHLKGNADTTWWWAIETDRMPARPNRRYRMAGWIKTKDATKEEGQYPNCNLYIQFGNDKGEVVLQDGSPVRATGKFRGTLDWTHVERIVKAPAGATHVLIGCILSVSGEAWFDDIGLYEVAPIPWAQQATNRFIYFFEKGSEKPPNAAIRANEKYLRSLEGVFGAKHEGKIHYYKYDTPDRKADVTGSSSRSHLEGDEIHSTAWTDAHDLVHLVMKPMGTSLAFLSEGIANYWDDTLNDRDVHDKARRLGTRRMVLPTARYLDPKFFHATSERLGNVVAKSFVGYLVEQYGLDKFKEFYEKVALDATVADVHEHFLSVYGVEFMTFDQAWRTWLKPKSSQP